MMLKSLNNRCLFILPILAILVIFLFSGCAPFKSKSDGAPTPAKMKNKNEPLYYDFGDVLVPRQLKVDKKSSFVFRTPGLSAGVLSLKGRVDVGSLIAFFENNMAGDNWVAVSSFKSPRTIMLFKKDNRWCVINITDKDFYTYVEIWVSPTLIESGSDLLK